MTLGSHQKTIGTSQVHITPRHILDALGPFDLDPCAADPRPWDCAKENLTEADDGLGSEWLPDEFVWCNPPFDRRVVGEWIAKMAAHGHGIALVHARTETQWFRPCWERGTAILFFGKRINFCQPDGKANSKANGVPGNSGAPVCFVAFGPLALIRLENCGLEGALVTAWQNH